MSLKHGKVSWTFGVALNVKFIAKLHQNVVVFVIASVLLDLEINTHWPSFQDIFEHTSRVFSDRISK